MSPFETRFGRVATRFAAVTAAAGLGAAGFAAPAAAQAPVPVETFLGFAGPFTAETVPRLQGFEAVFGDDFIPGEHTVSLSLSIDAGDDVFEFSGGDLDGRCAVNSTHTKIDCTQDEAPAEIRFELRVAVPDAGSAGSYPYAIELAVDGEVVHTEESEVQIITLSTGEDLRHPYEHSDVRLTGVDPGTSVEVSPEFLQEDPLPAGTVAVVLGFGHSEYGSGASAVADYGNCIVEYWGVACAVPEPPDEPGTVFAPSRPVSYAIDASAPGPFAVCGCGYSVDPIGSTEFEERFGDLHWDSDSMVDLRVVEEPESEFISQYGGTIVIETTENTIDLSVEPVHVKGNKGTETTVEVEYTNEGPGDAISHPDGPGTFLVLGSLPTGVELSADDATNANCFERPWSWDHYIPAIDPEVLEDLDFACFFINLESGQTQSIELRVEITENAPASDGTLAVVLQNGIMPDGDLSNNIATFSLNAKGDGNLPNTGTSLGLIIGIAGLVVVAGAILLVLTSRRRETTAEEAIEE